MTLKLHFSGVRIQALAIIANHSQGTSAGSQMGVGLVSHGQNPY